MSSDENVLDRYSEEARQLSVSFNPGAYSDEDVNALYWTLKQERRLRGLTTTNLWPIPTDPVALMLDRAIWALQARGQALETIRAEVDLPEHLAEIVGDALAKDAGRV